MNQKIPTIRELQREKKIPAAKIVAVIRELYPKFDAPSLSKVERAEYGTVLPEDARRHFYEVFAPEYVPLLKQKKPDPRRLTCRVSCRLTDEDFALLMERIKADGCSTNQEWLSNLIHKVVHNERNI